MKTRLMTPFFYLFSIPICLGTSFFHLKIVKINIPGPLRSILVGKISEFGGESSEIWILPRSIQETYTLRTVKTRFNFKIFRVISLSKVAE